MSYSKFNLLHSSTSIKAIALGSVLVLSACSGDDNDDEVRALEGRVDDLETRLMLSEESDSTLSDSLDAIEARIIELETDTDIEDEIETLSSLLDSLEERLDALETINESEYEITLTNASANQPLAPAALVLHYSDYRAWTIGMPASTELETLAESGNPAALLEMASDTQDAESSGALLLPGESLSVSLEGVWREDIALTAVSMPVNTNDAFSGATNWSLADLEPGDSIAALLPVYDAGTEFNSETSESVPGPAAGGEGFNAARDDIADIVARHPSVVTADDGYLESALNESHRFDQGILHVRVTRLSATE